MITQSRQSPGSAPHPPGVGVDRGSPELAQLRHHAQQLAQGQGAVTFWFGVSGSGKSRLLHQAAAVVTETVPHVRTVHVPGEGLGEAPVAGVATVVVHALDLPRTPDTGLLEESLRSGRSYAVSDPELLRMAIEVAASASASRPLLVLVDDLPEYAFDDLVSLTILASRIAELPVLVVCTSGHEPPDTTSLTSFGPLWMRRIEPLDETAVWSLATTYGAGFVPPSMAGTLRACTGGLPGDVAEVVRSLAPDELRGAVPLPFLLPLSTSTLQRARAWLEGLDQAHRRLVVAAATSPFHDRDVIEDAFDAALEDCGTGPDDRWFVSRGADFRFAQEDRRAAVRAVAVRRDVLAAHRTVAAAWPEGSAQRAWSEMAGGTAPTAQDLWIIADKARAELDTGDLETAATLAGDALRHAEDLDLRIDLSATLGLIAMHQGHLDTAYENLAAALTDAQDAETLGTVAGALVLTLVAREGALPTALVDAAIERLRGTSPAWALRLATLTARAHHFVTQPLTMPGDARLRPDPDGEPTERHYLTLAREIAEHCEDEEARYGLEFTEAFLAHEPEPTRPDLAERLGVAPGRRDVIGWDRAVSRLELACLCGELTGVARHAPDLRLRVDVHHSPLFSARMVAAELRTLLSLGLVQRALALCRQFMHDVPLHLIGPGVGVVLVAEVLTLAGTEDLAPQWVTAARLASHTYTTPVMNARVPMLLATRAELTGDVHAAVAQCAAAAPHVAALDLPPWHRVHVARLEYEHLAGRDVTGDPLLARLEDELDGVTDHVRALTSLALVRAMAGPSEEVLAAVADATRLSAQLVSPVQRARALITAMRALHRLDADEHRRQANALPSLEVPADANLHLSRLVARAAAAVADSGAEALLALVDRIGPSAPGVGNDRAPRPGSALPSRADGEADALTTEERTVAQMVLAGASNKQVAAALFLSVRTVELRLTSIYRKLGISSRKELPRAMAVRDAPPARTSFAPLEGREASGANSRDGAGPGS